MIIKNLFQNNNQMKIAKVLNNFLNINNNNKQIQIKSSKLIIIK